MAKSVFALVLVGCIVSVLVSACFWGNSVSGKYVNPNNHEQYIILKDDGTFYFVGGWGLRGTWDIEGDTLLFSTGFGVVDAQIKGDTIFMDDDGGAWIKSD